ncbi:MAG: TIGR02147 family protein [Bdellovibrionales bacterium]
MEKEIVPSNIPVPVEREGALKRPRIYDYLDYRKYLGEMLKFKKETRGSFSLAVFSKKAGLQTRNYLKRVIDGERNLSSENIPKFCIGFELTRKESLYFEALVNYSQNKNEVSKKHYFDLLRAAADGEQNAAVEIAHDQFEVFNHWYILAIRELVLLKDFDESPQYISKKLKNKVTPKQAKHAIEVLLKTGLLRKNDQQRLVQSDPTIQYSQDIVNLQIRRYHTQNLERASESIKEDSFESWNVRALTIAIDKDKNEEIQKAINQFFGEINRRYSVIDPQQSQCNSVIQMNVQMYELTEDSAPKKTNPLTSQEGEDV